MRVLLLGATGLIGSAVAARLHTEGIEVVGVARSAGSMARRLPVARWIELDLRRACAPADWLPHLGGIDAVVNCAGVLQDNARDSTALVHAKAPEALWRACEQAGVQRIVQVSAIGVDRGGLTLFSASKAAGDASLRGSSLDWIILRPSVVLGRVAHGGSALIRALASLPFLPRLPNAGRIDVVQLDDVAETIVILLRDGAARHIALELAGPERLSFEEVVAAYRKWLGRRPARLIAFPAWVIAALCRLGDGVAWLGWRPALRTTARRELERGAIGDPTEWTRVTGIRPRSLGESLAAGPSGAQERWFANLYLLKPLLIGIFSMFWLATGIIALRPGQESAAAIMRAAGAGSFSLPCVVAGSLADIVIGIAMAFRRSARIALLAALFVSICYVIAATLLVPALWADPLGPIMKIWPIMALNLACLAIVKER